MSTFWPYHSLFIEGYLLCLVSYIIIIVSAGFIVFQYFVWIKCRRIIRYIQVYNFHKWNTVPCIIGVSQDEVGSTVYGNSTEAHFECNILHTVFVVIFARSLVVQTLFSIIYCKGEILTRLWFPLELIQAVSDFCPQSVGLIQENQIITALYNTETWKKSTILKPEWVMIF